MMSKLRMLKGIINHPLNRGNKLKSILRFGKWQIGSRLVSSTIVYDWINESKFFVKTGETGLTGNIYMGLHEFQEMGYLLHVLKDDELFVDVGANSGSYTILACSVIGARGYAFEPVASSYKRLVENIRLNHMEDRVNILNVGVGRERGKLSFVNNMDTVNHVLAPGEESEGTVSVEVLALDTVLQSESPSLMKIDVEGYETPVLEGALKTLEKRTLHSVIIELNGSGGKYGYDESKILEIMFDHGFKTYSYNPLQKALVGLKGKNPNSGNTLFIRDKPLVLDRLKNISKININGRFV